MNYFNPYYASYPIVTRTNIFKNLFSNINFSSILSGTSKTLNVVNQAIPLVKQAGPIYKNAKTMFKVMNEFKKVDRNEVKKQDTIKEENKKEEIKTSSLGPTFFL